MWAMSTPALRSIATSSTNNNNNNNNNTNNNTDDVIVIDQNDSKKRKRTKSSPNNNNNNNSSTSSSSSMDMKATGSLVTFTQLITILTQPGVPHSLFNIGCGSEESCTPSTLKEIRGKRQKKEKSDSKNIYQVEICFFSLFSNVIIYFLNFFLFYCYAGLSSASSFSSTPLWTSMTTSMRTQRMVLDYSCNYICWWCNSKDETKDITR